MRKKAPRRTSSRKSITKPAAQRPLQIAKETLRTLSSDELTQAATGAVAIGCPWNSGQTTTQHDTNPPPDHNDR